MANSTAIDTHVWSLAHRILTLGVQKFNAKYAVPTNIVRRVFQFIASFRPGKTGEDVCLEM